MDFSHELYAAFADELANIASSDKEASHTSKALDFARLHSGVVNHGLASSVAAKMHPAAHMIEDPEGMKMILRHHADKATSDHLKAFSKKAGAMRNLRMFGSAARKPGGLPGISNRLSLG
jgi:hypothetical protein